VYIKNKKVLQEYYANVTAFNLTEQISHVKDDIIIGNATTLVGGTLGVSKE